MSFELFKAGCLIMIIGMGFVYFFIAIMIYCMNINAKVIKMINKFFPEKIEEDNYISKKKTSDNDAEVALAIACAALKRGKAC